MRCALPLPPVFSGPAFCNTPRIAHRLLCVDDDPVAQRILMAVLAGRDWAVECVCAAEHAVDRLARDPQAFDLLVTDHAMPVIDGLGLVHRLRGLGFAGPVIVVAAHLTGEERAGYRAAGATALILKPFRKEALLAAVQQSLALPAAEVVRGG